MNMDMPCWLGVSVPSGTPADAQSKLQKDVLAVLASPEVKKRLGDMGVAVIGSSTEAAKLQVEGDMQKWATLMKATGIKAD